MKTLFETVREDVEKAVAIAFPELNNPDPLLKETQEASFGDYQINLAMSLSKILGRKPHEIAETLKAVLVSSPLYDKVEIKGPGFINLFLNEGLIKEKLAALFLDNRLGVSLTQKPETHVVDFSSVNLAKEMHIGHLRTTVTGEVICRVLEFLGHPVERVNHVGDWGTPFGMLLELMFDEVPLVLNNPHLFNVTDLEGFYKRAKERFDLDEDFKERARQRVVKLQAHDSDTITLWKIFLAESLKHCHQIYKALDVTLIDRGESFYNNDLSAVVQEMLDKQVAKLDEGAVCYFSNQYKNREGESQPLLVQKKDGGYNYATTDLAAIRYRVLVTKAKRIIYITDIRQAQHFSMVFEAAHAMNWASAVDLKHIGYGMILNKDRQPFKTRQGGNVRLRDVLEEAHLRSQKIVAQSERGYSDAEKAEIAQKVALSAVKYYDLSHNLASDYVFDWDDMLAMEGNTGPYMLYAFARLMGIQRKADLQESAISQGLILWDLSHPTEIQLAKNILKFPEVVYKMAQELRPNILTDYLYNLCKVFNTFYDKKSGVQVLDAQTPDQRKSRLALCALTAKVLRQGLNLLSIDVVLKM